MNNQASIVIALRQQNEQLKNRLQGAQHENSVLARQFDIIYEQIRAVQSGECAIAELRCGCANSAAPGFIQPFIFAIVRETMRFDASALGKSFAELRETVSRVERSFACLQLQLREAGVKASSQPTAAQRDKSWARDEANHQTTSENVQNSNQLVRASLPAQESQRAGIESAVQTEADHSLRAEMAECKRRLEIATAACQRLAVENETLKDQIKQLQNGQEKPGQQTGKWPQLITLQRQCEILEKVLEMAFTR